MTEDLITIKTYNFVHEAELDRSLLESHGIPAFVMDQVAGTAAPYITGGLRLQVRVSDLAKCRDLLNLERPDDYAKNSSTPHIALIITGYLTLVVVIIYTVLAIKSFF